MNDENRDRGPSPYRIGRGPVDDVIGLLNLTFSQSASGVCPLDPHKIILLASAVLWP